MGFPQLQSRHPDSVNANNVTVGLTGVVGLGFVGQCATAVTPSLAAVVGVGVPGSLSPNLVLAAVIGVGATGVLAPLANYALTANIVTGVLGNLSVQTGQNVTVTVTGVAGIGILGSVTAFGASTTFIPRVIAFTTAIATSYTLTVQT